jgi:hypothetical protein
VDERDLLLGAFVAVEGAHAFSAFMPSYFTIRKFAAAPEDAERLRSGYVPAVGFNIALGAVISALVRSPWPLLAGIAVSAFMVAMYENAIRQAEAERAR